MLEQILNDRTHGASVLLEQTCDWLRESLKEGVLIPPDVFDQLVRAHAGMACFFHLRNWMGTHKLTLQSLAAFEDRVHWEWEMTLKRFQDNFPSRAKRLSVFSHSGVVIRALKELARLDLELDVALNGPSCEGRCMAADLTEAGFKQVTLRTDGDWFSRLPEQDALIMGCDAYSNERFINRAGSGGAVDLAGAADIPVLVVAGPMKRLPDAVLGRMPLKDGDPGEVSNGAVSYQVAYPLFERVDRAGVLLVGPKHGSTERGSTEP